MCYSDFWNVLAILDPSRCILIFDGLDEVRSPSDAATALADLLRAYPSLAVVVSCRPATYREELSDFQVLTLVGLDALGRVELISKLAEGDQDLVRRFERAVAEDYGILEDLTSNPLLLELSSRAFRRLDLLSALIPRR